MGNTLRFFRSTSPYANAVAFAALAIWLVKALWLDSLPPLFPKAAVVGDVVEVTLSQIVASYVFYLFFVHKQELEDRRLVGPYVHKHATLLYGDCQRILAEVSRASGAALELDSCTKDDVALAMSQVETSSPPNMVVDQAGTHATWYQYFDHQARRTNASAKKLLALGRLVDPRLAKGVAEIADSDFLNQMNMIATLKMSNHTLETWSRSFWSYVLKAREVKDWCERHPNL